jgi:outer membrane immunogenic protein
LNALVGQQPFPSHKFNQDGIIGGFQLGYNWQLERRWVVGLEADINDSGISGSGTGTSALQNIPGVAFVNNLASTQKLDWFGTVRGRVGFLATDDLLLFGTGGFAYGRVKQSDTYTFPGSVPGAGFAVTLVPFSFACTSGPACFTGSSSRTNTGWTAGGGAEWRFLPNWSVKAEYLYINLGGDAVTAVATGVAAPGLTPASYRASFGDADYHIVRVGLNWHF